MARVHVLKEVCDEKESGWRLCLQWASYLYDDKTARYGYRFVWRRPDEEGGGLEAGRGQTRIPSLNEATNLIARAVAEGWGNRDGNKMEAAAERLRKAGCVVDFYAGYVGWPTKEAARAGQMTPQSMEDTMIVQEWS
jgi:hypothetical protein